MHHTCGSVRPLIPDFIDAASTSCSLLQPRARTWTWPSSRRSLAATCASTARSTFRKPCRGARRRTCAPSVAALWRPAKPGGGFIISTAHNLLPDVPVENILALYDACRELAPLLSAVAGEERRAPWRGRTSLLFQAGAAAPTSVALAGTQRAHPRLRPNARVRRRADGHCAADVLRRS